MRRCHLGAIDVGKRDEEAISNAQDQTAKIENAPVGGADLDGGPGSGQETRKPESRFATKEMGEGARKDDERNGPRINKDPISCWNVLYLAIIIYILFLHRYALGLAGPTL